MHTVFINTTKNVIGGRFDSLKNAKDLKKLMYVDCPLDTWYDEENGYQEVTLKIADFIDTYNDVSNDYNIVVYADMVMLFDLLKINFFDADRVEQAFLSKLCQRGISRLIASTLLKKLNEDGRVPSEKPVLLLELPATKEVPAGIDSITWQTEALRSFLHLVPMDQLQQKLTAETEKKQVPLSEIVDEVQKSLKIDLCELYQESIRIMADSVTMDGLPVQRACNNLYDAIEKLFEKDCASNLAISEYHTNKRTQKLSLEVYTKHNFLLQCLILDCINSETAFNGENEPKQIPELSEAEWETVKNTLYRKQRTYEVERKKLANLSSDFTKLNLAPSLYMLAREKFGLNESGNIKSEYVIRTEPKKKNNDAKASEKDSLEERREELAAQNGAVQTWFTKSEYKPYDSAGDAYTAVYGKATADEYCQRATDLANHHLNLFNKLNMHVKRVMANYSGRSISNAPPVLRKRTVNIGQNIDESEKNDYKYAKRHGADLIPEEEATETVIDTAKRSYISMIMECLKFDVGRGIAMTNIKEQCDWFVKRIRKIEESLKKLLWIFVVLCVTLAVV